MTCHLVSSLIHLMTEIMHLFVYWCFRVSAIMLPMSDYTVQTVWGSYSGTQPILVTTNHEVARLVMQMGEKTKITHLVANMQSSLRHFISNFILPSISIFCFYFSFNNLHGLHLLVVRSSVGGPVWSVKESRYRIATVPRS